MKKVLTWIILIWTVLAVPYVFEAQDVYSLFGGALYLGLIIYLTISDLKEAEKKEVRNNGN